MGQRECRPGLEELSAEEKIQQCCCLSPGIPRRAGFLRLMNREISCIMINIQALTKAVPINHLQEPPQERPRFRERILSFYGAPECVVQI
jgi:hypothetical protein